MAENSKAGDTQLSVKEVAKRYDRDRRIQEKFRATKQAVKLLNFKEADNRSFRIYNKERLRAFIKNPAKNAAELRALSQFLYRLSYPYRRIIQYYAGMTDLSAMVCIPKVDIQNKPKLNKVRLDYGRVLAEHQKMNMKSQIFKLLVIAWREDAVYAYAYEDEDAFFLLPLDGDYCRIASQNYDGTYNIAFNFSYFNAHKSYLEYWADEFRIKYELYQKNTTDYLWQELDIERTFCIKINGEDPLLYLPPFLPLFESIIDLIDLQSLQAVKDALSAYKLLVMEEETIERATQPDQFTVDIDSAEVYYDRLLEMLPDEVAAAISLLPIKVIDFKGENTEDVDMISNSMSNLFKSAGVSQILDRNKIEGAVAFEAAMVSDSVLSTANVLPQIETWVNRYISYRLKSSQARVKYLPVTPYTKSGYLSRVMNAAQFGVPVKMQVAALLNQDPYETYAMEYLENDLLALHDEWIPLNSTHTQSSVNGQEKTETNPNGAGRPVTTGEDAATTTERTERTETSTTTTSNGSTTTSTTSSSVSSGM